MLQTAFNFPMQLLRRRAPGRPLAVALTVSLALFAAACGSSAEGVPERDGQPEATAPSDQSPVYLALGDSLAVGVGASSWPTGGYVPRLLTMLNADRSQDTELVLVNVGRSGADTLSAIEEGQLAEAVAEIEARRVTAVTTDDVEVITVGIGGNDAFALVPLCSGVIDDACLDAAGQQIREVRKRLAFIVEALRDAAGPDARIAVMTYYNPLIHEGCPLHEFELIGDVVLEGEATLGVPDGLNDEIRAAAASTGVPVAEVGELSVDELTGDCLHASDAGHARIAMAFQQALNS